MFCFLSFFPLEPLPTGVHLAIANLVDVFGIYFDFLWRRWMFSYLGMPYIFTSFALLISYFLDQYCHQTFVQSNFKYELFSDKGKNMVLWTPIFILYYWHFFCKRHHHPRCLTIYMVRSHGNFNNKLMLDMIHTTSFSLWGNITFCSITASC